MDSRKRIAAWATGTVAGVLLPFAPAVLGLRTLSFRDTDQLYAPLRTLVVEALREGRLPLWNPYEAAGKPLFAEGIHSVLHPISLAGAALAPSSIDFLLLAYLVAAALGAFSLARTLGASPPASMGAGLAFALSGFSVSMTGNLVFLAGLSTLPWLVAAARTAGTGSPWGPVATGIATACAFFSGDTQVTLVGLVLGMALAADAGGPRGLLRALSGMVAGGLLAGVQIAATQELLPRTYRSLDLRSWEKTLWSLSPGRLLEWAIPGLFRGPPAVAPRAASGAWLDPPFAESVHLGAPLLVAAVLGTWSPAARDRRRTGLLLGLTGAVVLWLALGHHLGARQLLDWVPVWNKFRYSEKLMAPLTLCVCALGALGIDAFGAGRLSRRSTYALAATALAAGFALLALLLAPSATLTVATHLLGDAGSFYRSNLASGLPHLVAGLAALLAIDRLRLAPARTMALSLLVALAAAAAVYSGAHLGSHDARRFTSPLRLDTDSPNPRIATPAEKEFDPADLVDCIESPARFRSIALSPSVNVAHRVDTLEPYGGFEGRRITTLSLSFGPSWTRHFRRFGLTHIVVPVPFGERFREQVALAVEGGQLVQRDAALGFELWAVPHRPWAFFPQRAIASDLPQDAHRTLLDLMARGEDDTVVVEAPAPPPTSPGRVLRIERGTESVRVEAESAAPALLVLQDAHWPGWRASIDGEPAEILIADLFVRAVRWPPGRHRLEMVYDPPGVRFGLALSALGAVLLLLLAALAVRRLRRPTGECERPILPVQ